MRRKRTYSTTDIKQVEVGALALAPVSRCVVAIDVAKEKFVAAIGTESCDLVKLVHFRHPDESRLVLTLLRQLHERGNPPSVLLEPTGTYGDALRAQIAAQGHPVFMVQPKHTHDAHELMDGVPSTHDPKAAATLLFLHRNGNSRPWQEASEHQREVRALLDRVQMHRRASEQRYGILEAKLARHWPEFMQWLDPRQQWSATALLRQCPCPAMVAQHPEETAALLRRASRGALDETLIQGFIEAARDSLGVAMVEAERVLVQELVEEIDHHERIAQDLERQLERRMKGDAAFERIAKVGGVALAAAIIALLGAPSGYGSSRAMLKAAGLNLAHHQSGEKDRPLRISKRGPSLVRQLLYMAALRWIHRDPVAKAWYVGRGLYGEGTRTAAVVALMRKLLKGLYRVGKHDEPFDTSKLFDVRRLDVSNNARTKGVRPPRRTEKRSAVRRPARSRRTHLPQGGAQA